VVVLYDQFGAGQVRTRFSTRGILAMAESALRPKPSLTLADLSGSIGLRRSRFQPRARSWALALGTRRPLRILLAENSRRQRHEDTADQYG